MCRRWHVFENFWVDMGTSYVPGLSIERKNNERGYSKSNCRWATPLEQARNKRNNRHIGSLTVAEAAERAGLNRSTVYERIRAGWPEADWLKPLIS